VVYCIEGRVLDVVLDLRVGSPTFKQHLALELSPDSDSLLYIPEGLAHGFCALSERVTMYYKVSTVYSPQHDAGIFWNSIGFSWPVENPIFSARDGGFPSLDNFSSPFVFSSGGTMFPERDKV
jgi:dTDP-4-dehydrorhamnose 3,5-epimerase